MCAGLQKQSVQAYQTQVKAARANTKKIKKKGGEREEEGAHSPSSILRPCIDGDAKDRQDTPHTEPMHPLPRGQWRRSAGTAVSVVVDVDIDGVFVLAAKLLRLFLCQGVACND